MGQASSADFQKRKQAGDAEIDALVEVPDGLTSQFAFAGFVALQ
jgi:hypothetical protein